MEKSFSIFQLKNTQIYELAITILGIYYILYRNMCLGYIITQHEGTSWTSNSSGWVSDSHSCPILYDPMNYTVHGILQAKILEWVAFPFSRRSFQLRDQTQVSCITGRLFYQLNHQESRGRGLLLLCASTEPWVSKLFLSVFLLHSQLSSTFASMHFRGFSLPVFAPLQQ